MTLLLTKQTLSIAGHRVIIELPSSQDQLLEEALQCEHSGSLDGDPYWGTVWATAPKLAEMILRQTWPSPMKALELGCGIGVAGIAALIAGHDVTFADHASAAVKMAVANATLNGFENEAGLVFDWKQPTSDQFDFIFASDVLYDPGNFEPLLMTFNAMLSIHGVVWIGDPGRANAILFAELAIGSGWDVKYLDQSAQPYPQPQHAQFRLLVLQRSTS